MHIRSVTDVGWLVLSLRRVLSHSDFIFDGAASKLAWQVVHRPNHRSHMIKKEVGVVGCGPLASLWLWLGLLEASRGGDGDGAAPGR
jgi:hypothetical protein